jgi:hypothetical protein
MTVTSNGKLSATGAIREAVPVILAAAFEEQLAKYGTKPNMDWSTPVPDGFDVVGAFMFLPVIKRADQPLMPSTVLWVWPYQDPNLLDGWTLSQLEALFPQWEPSVAL